MFIFSWGGKREWCCTFPENPNWLVCFMVLAALMPSTVPTPVHLETLWHETQGGWIAVKSAPVICVIIPKPCLSSHCHGDCRCSRFLPLVTVSHTQTLFPSPTVPLVHIYIWLNQSEHYVIKYFEMTGPRLFDTWHTCQIVLTAWLMPIVTLWVNSSTLQFQMERML